MTKKKENSKADDGNRNAIPAKEFQGDIGENDGFLYKSKKCTELDVRDHYQLYGENIPEFNNKLADAIKEARLETNFKPGDVVKNEIYKYAIESVKGNDSFKVKDLKQNDDRLFLRVESSNVPYGGPRLEFDVRVLLKARELAAPFRHHFLKLIDRGQVNDQYRFVVTRLGGENLVDLRRKNSVDFLPSTAVRLALQSLQAIHDIHLCGYIHRDIQPRNFVVGRDKNANVLYVVNFGFGCTFTPPSKKLRKNRLEKLPVHNRNFQSRTYHRYGYIRRLHDIESWCYLVHYLFNASCLPWDAVTMREREIYNHKWLFFIGHYDEMFVKKGLPRRLKSLRERINLEQAQKPVEYPVFGEALLSIAENMNLNWSAPYEWEPSFEKWVRGKAVAELNERSCSSPHKHKNAASCGDCKMVAEAKKIAKDEKDILVGNDPIKSVTGSAKVKEIKAMNSAISSIMSKSKKKGKRHFSASLSSSSSSTSTSDYDSDPITSMNTTTTKEDVTTTGTTITGFKKY